MEASPYQLLQGAIRIAHRSLDEPQRALHRILRLLRRSLALADCRLLLLAADGQTYHQTLTAGGPPHFLPTSQAAPGSAERRCLAEQRAVAQGHQRYYPLFSRYRQWGVLQLELSAASPAAVADDPDFFRATCEQLAMLVALARGSEASGEEQLPARWQALSAENDRKFREIALLYRLSRAMHSTLRLNELMHLILSAITLPEGGGFERAMLFMVNERSGVLQGILGVTSATASLVLPPRTAVGDWEQPAVSAASREAQRQAPFCRQVMKLRLALDPADNPLAQAVTERRTVQADDQEAAAPLLAVRPRLGAFACTPLLGREGPLAVLVVDNPSMSGTFLPRRLRFLQLFASQAEAAMENSMLLHRLQTAHQDLRETQERLIQGEKMAVLGEMAASVAHELRNPLVSIGGFARRLARQLEEQERQAGEYAAIIAREVRRMEKMLANILAFSRQNMLCLAECQLGDILAETLTVEQDALRQAGVALELDVAEALPPLQGDAQKLRQVVSNLLANARQAMEPEGGVLTVRLSPSTLRGDQAVALEVEDTGGGISIEVLRNIFNPFFTTKEEGTGLGLSISHRIVDHHGGEIEVQNRRRGAAFIVRLPVAGRGKLSVDKSGRFG